MKGGKKDALQSGRDRYTTKNYYQQDKRKELKKENKNKYGGQIAFEAWIILYPFKNEIYNTTHTVVQVRY